MAWIAFAFLLLIAFFIGNVTGYEQGRNSALDPHPMDWDIDTDTEDSSLGIELSPAS